MLNNLINNLGDLKLGSFDIDHKKLINFEQSKLDLDDPTFTNKNFQACLILSVLRLYSFLFLFGCSSRQESVHRSALDFYFHFNSKHSIVVFKIIDANFRT